MANTNKHDRTVQQEAGTSRPAKTIPPKAKRYYRTVQQEAARLGVPDTWIYKRVRMQGDKKLPHRKAGKYLLFVEEWTDKYLDDQTDKYFDDQTE
jgi:hypothetical protein